MLTARPVGLIATAGTAGSVTVQFAQGVADATNTALHVSSWVKPDLDSRWRYPLREVLGGAVFLHG